MKHILSISFLLVAASLSVGAAEQGEHVIYQVDELSYEGYFVSPLTEPPADAAPLVLLIHDWDGLTDYEVQRADMLADMGFAVFAADLFGAGIRPDKVEDRRQHTGELYTDRQKMRRLMMGALEIAKARGANVDNAAAMGYCFGGAAVLELARSGAKLKGFATFHGGLSTPEGQNYHDVQGKLLILHGAADTAISMEQFAALANELEGAGVDHEMVAYGGAPHSFTVFGSSRYRKEADEQSWRRFIEFLRAEL